MEKLKVLGVSKSFDGESVIRDIHIELREGELVSLLGISGGGKTTLFNVIAGLSLPDQGQVLLDGRDITGQPGNVSYMLQKDLLLPFKEQNHKVRPGEQCLVALYIDKSGRLAATMNVYSYMNADSPYKKDDQVTGTVYEINENLGAFVAVDNRYYGMIPKAELYGDLHPGDPVQARVGRVREDGKLDLSPRQKAYVQMDADAELVMKVIDEFDGVLPFNDKAKPETIMREFKLSKNAFKRAVGRLLKENKIRITEKTIERI